MTGSPSVTTACKDSGSVAVLMCYLVLIGATLAGFLVDAGARLQAATRADTIASEAARAASIAIGPIPTTSSDATLRAAAAARTYLAQVGATGTVTVTGPAAVQVAVTVTASTPVLGITIHATGQHTAQLQVGVTSGEPVA